MPKNLLLTALFSVFFFFNLLAQDLHQTDYRLSPLLLNPAYTGSFYGTVRIGGVYRDQFQTFIDQGWQSTGVYFDSPILKGIKKNDWIGIGLFIASDQVNVAELSTAATYFSVAYHMGLDQDRTSQLTIGLQYGQANRKIDRGDLVVFSDELLNGAGSSSDREYIDGFDVGYSDLNAGIKLTVKTSDASTFEIGGSAMHLLLPSKVEDFLNLRFNVHSSYAFSVTERLQFEPVLYFSTIKTASVFSAQWRTQYLLDKEKDTQLRLGLGYRSNDAMQILVGGQYQDWNVGLAFDATISQASTYTNGFGGFEVGISKIIKIYKKPESTPTIICPLF